MNHPVLWSAALALLASCSAAPSLSKDATEAVPSALPAAGLNLVSKGVGADRYVSPVSQPTLFETPAIQREVRPMFMYQRLPSDSAFQGGDFQVYAVQARVPLTERLAIIATKDGFIDFNPDAGTDETGFADIAAGLKYAAFVDEASGLIVTPGITYEFDTGDHEVFQGRGDGLLRPFVSTGLEVEGVRLLGTLGYSLPLHGGDESQSIDYHVHADYDVGKGFAPLVEFHGITYTRDGNALPFNFEGGDLINLGSTNVEGQSVFRLAFGGRYQAADNVSLGATWEIPIGREDLHDGRATIDAVVVF